VFLLMAVMFIASCIMVLSFLVRAWRASTTECVVTSMEPVSCARFGGKDVTECAWVTFNATLCDGKYNSSVRDGIFLKDAPEYEVNRNATCMYDPRSCTLLYAGDHRPGPGDIAAVSGYFAMGILIYWLMKSCMTPGYENECNNYDGGDRERERWFSIEVRGCKGLDACVSMVPCCNALNLDR